MCISVSVTIYLIVSYHFISNQHELGSRGIWDTFATKSSVPVDISQVENISATTCSTCASEPRQREGGSGKWKQIDVKATSKLKSSDVSHLPTWVPSWFCRLGFWKLCACRQLGSIDQATTTNDLGQVASKHPKTRGRCKDLPSIPPLVLGTFCQTRLPEEILAFRSFPRVQQPHPKNKIRDHSNLNP